MLPAGKWPSAKYLLASSMVIASNSFWFAQLIEDGFEYVCDQENLKFFRKRK
jgi:hypothetical protein